MVVKHIRWNRSMQAWEVGPVVIALAQLHGEHSVDIVWLSQRADPPSPHLSCRVHWGRQATSLRWTAGLDVYGPDPLSRRGQGQG